MAPKFKDLSPMQLLYVAARVKGLTQRDAAREAGCSAEGNGASVSASRWEKMPAVRRAIDSARVQIMQRAKIDAGYVLDKSVEVAERCLQEIRPALHPKTRVQMKDEDGNALYTFNAAGAIAALRMVGDHVSVRAFEENIRLTAGESLVERLRAGRNRARPMIELNPVASRDPSNESSDDE